MRAGIVPLRIEIPKEATLTAFVKLNNRTNYCSTGFEVIRPVDLFFVINFMFGSVLFITHLLME